MPVNSHEILDRLINDAVSGIPEALAELSSIALGGNTNAQQAILQLEQSPTTPPPVSGGNPPNIVWPSKVKREKRGPQRGDIPEHYNI